MKSVPTNTSTKPLWLKNPLSILDKSMLEGGKSKADGGIVVDGNKIIELVEAGKIPSVDEYDVLDCSEMVILPGLINTHHHMYQTLTRAHPDAINKELFDWLVALYPVWGKVVNRDSFRLATRLALTELVMSGATTVSDHQYLFPEGLEDAMDIQAEEAANLGIRIILNRGSMDLSKKDGGLPPDSVVQDADTILADSKRIIDKYHDTEDGAMCQVALAPCSPFSVSTRLMRETADLASKCNCRLHTHLGETHDEDEYCLDKFSCRPVDYLEENGWLNERTWLAHGIHFNDEEIGRLGKHGVGVCHCPTSNMVLASGSCRTLELERSGSPVGLGVDGSASNDNSNLMEGVRHALMINRLSYGAKDFTHIDALRFATQGSANCLGRNDVGTIEVGKQADLALYKLDELRFSGAGDPMAALVLCGAHAADRVMVAGKWIVENRLPINIDIEKLRHDHTAIARQLMEAI